MLRSVVVALVAVAVQTGDPALSAALRDDPATGRADLELTNTAAKVVVAWTVRYLNEAGQETGGQSTDSLAALMGERPSPRILQPGRPTIVSPASTSKGRPTTVVPVAVVYEDDTAAGDPEAIATIFDRRRRQADAWSGVIPTLEALSANVTPQTLRFAAAEFKDPKSHHPQEVRGGMINNLELAASSEDPQRTFGHVLDYTRRLAAHFRAHSARR